MRIYRIPQRAYSLSNCCFSVHWQNRLSKQLEWCYALSIDSGTHSWPLKVAGSKPIHLPISFPQFTDSPLPIRWFFPSFGHEKKSSRWSKYKKRYLLPKEWVIANPNNVDDTCWANHAEERGFIQDIKEGRVSLLDSDQNIRIYWSNPKSNKKAKNRSVMSNIIPTYLCFTSELKKTQNNDPQRNDTEEKESDKKP